MITTDWVKHAVTCGMPHNSQYTVKARSLVVCGQLHSADGVLAVVQALDGVDRLQLAQQLHLTGLQQKLRYTKGAVTPLINTDEHVFAHIQIVCLAVVDTVGPYDSALTNYKRSCRIMVALECNNRPTVRGTV
jgi:hypothetical protein